MNEKIRKWGKWENFSIFAYSHFLIYSISYFHILTLHSDSVHLLEDLVLLAADLHAEAAAELGRQITDRSFDKLYLAVAHGCPKDAEGRFDDLLFRDTYKGMTYPVKRMRKGVRDAALEYSVLGEAEGLSLNRIHLLTGRMKEEEAEDSDEELEEQADEYLVISHGVLEFDEALSESVFLEFPMVLLCSPDCRGLCPHCGRKLTGSEICGCTPREIDPRWSKLRDIQWDENGSIKKS